MTWTSAFGRACGSLIRVIVNRMALARISPNILTFMGLLINVAAAVLFGYSDAALFFGLLVYYARANRFFYVVLAALVMISCIMVSYTRARAESRIYTCKVGFMERPERLLLPIIGAHVNRMAPVLWVIAVLSTIPVIRRMYYPWVETERMDTVADQAA